MSFLDVPRAAELQALLEERLPDKTLRHALSVTSLCEQAAPAAGVDRVKAVHAGLLHDLFKKEKKDSLLALVREYGITPSPLQQDHPKLLHGPVAAEYARRELAIDDPDVYDAVYWHTTGRPGLCRVGQVLYFADFSEPFRPMAESATARELLQTEGFDAALRYAAHAKMAYVRLKQSIDPEGEAFLAWLINQA